MEMMKDTVFLSVNIWFRDDQTINVVDVPLSNTIGQIKEVVCDQLVEDIGKTFAYEPRAFQMVLSDASVFMDDDSSKTLAQVLDDDDDFDYPKSNCLDITLYPSGTKLHQNVSSKDDGGKNYYYENFIDDGEEDCVNSDDELEIILPEDAFTLKRPEDGILPTNGRCLRVCGEKQRYVPSNGFSYPLEYVTKLSSPAFLVLLAFNSQNMHILEEFHSSAEEVDTLLSECDASSVSDDYEASEAKILVLQVGWDKLSYLFLRMLRKYLGHDLDIVAVTDLDVHHLDLLVFLDTPPRDIPELYGGWDLFQDCARLGIHDTQCVDIKWLGIRPSDAETSSQFRSCFANPSHRHPDDFSEVYEFLKAHPHVAAKIDWVQELELMFSKKLHRSFPYIADGVHWRINDDVQKSFTNYLLKKINQQDWI